MPFSNTPKSPVVAVTEPETDDHSKVGLSACLRKYHPYFSLMVSDSTTIDNNSNMVRMKCNLKNCSNNNGKGISSSKISAANLVKHIRGQHKIDADKILKANFC